MAVLFKKLDGVSANIGFPSDAFWWFNITLYQDPLYVDGNIGCLCIDGSDGMGHLHGNGDNPSFGWFPGIGDFYFFGSNFADNLMLVFQYYRDLSGNPPMINITPEDPGYENFITVAPASGPYPRSATVPLNWTVTHYKVAIARLSPPVLIVSLPFSDLTFWGALNRFAAVNSRRYEISDKGGLVWVLCEDPLGSDRFTADNAIHGIRTFDTPSSMGLDGNVTPKI